MKQYTHAWLAFMAMKRLENTDLSSSNRKYADSLIKWFKNHKDFVVQGAWYPDSVIKDMATSHILKYQPNSESKVKTFRKLPKSYHIQEIGKSGKFYKKPYQIVKGNLPDRCESLAHSIIDNLKMQESEDKGSPIAPTDNHVATIFFMLSHYVADAHMPLHCDARPFSNGDNVHAHIEHEWDEMVRECYSIDFDNERFFYNKDGYPIKHNNLQLADWLEQEIINRKYYSGWGKGNSNTWDFMAAITQYSYLTAYELIPENYNEDNLTNNVFDNLNREIDFETFSKYLLIDAIDSISRVWLRVWIKYQKWVNR